MRDYLGGIVENSAAMGDVLAKELPQLQERHPSIGEVRGKGLFWGIELVRDKATGEAFPYGLQVGAQVCARAAAYGVIVRPLADVIVVMPPLVISLDNVDHLLNTLERCINEVVPHVRRGVSDGLE